MSEAGERPAFYALETGGWRDYWTLLHPPYTVWHLSYVVIGACLAPHVPWGRLALTVLAFFLALGIAAHALDELNGRPLRTQIPTSVLVVLVPRRAVGIDDVVDICHGPILLGDSSKETPQRARQVSASTSSRIVTPRPSSSAPRRSSSRRTRFTVALDVPASDASPSWVRRTVPSG